MTHHPILTGVLTAAAAFAVAACNNEPPPAPVEHIATCITAEGQQKLGFKESNGEVYLTRIVGRASQARIIGMNGQERINGRLPDDQSYGMIEPANPHDDTYAARAAADNEARRIVQERARMDRGALIDDLAQRFRTACGNAPVTGNVPGIVTQAKNFSLPPS